MKTIYLLALILACIHINAQNYDISGKIVDKKNKNALSNVNVGLQGTYYGSTTDQNGNFRIPEIPKGDYILCISAVGYELQQQVFSVQDNINGLLIEINEKPVELDQVVVTASRTERDLKNVPIAVQVISGKTIEKMQVSNMRDLLEYELPGIDFTNNGGYAKINMLGFGSKYILFLVDGERMSGESFDNIDYNRINTENIERIEIVKGASSSLYGSNAVGGVINIITKKPSNPFNAQAVTRFGSNEEQNHNLSVNSKQKWGWASLTGAYKTRGVYQLRGINVAGYEDYSISPKVSFNLGSKFEIEAHGGYFFKERNPGGQDGKKIRDRFYDYNGGLKGSYTISDKQHISVSGNYDEYDKYDFYKRLNEEEQKYGNKQIRLGAVYDMVIAGRHSLVTGVEYFADDLMTYMFESDGANENRDARTYSAFAQQDWVLNDKVTLVGGLRYDYHSQFRGHLSPRLSAMYKPAGKITIRGGYSGGFRSPTLKELYTDWYHPYGGGFQIKGNENLKAEVSNNFNLSAEGSFGKTSVTAMGQFSIIDNQIDNVWLHEDTIQYFNMGKTKIFSTELSVSHRLSNNIYLKGAYTYVKNDLGKRSTTRPHTATLRIDYTSSFFKKYNPALSFSGKYFGGVDIYKLGSTDEIDDEAGVVVDSEDVKTHYEAYSVWRLTLAQPLPFNFTLSAGINNLFDYRAKSYSFYSSVSPGRTFYIGLRWSLK